MATFRAFNQFDITAIDFSFYYENYEDSELQEDANVSFQNVTYVDFFSVNGSDNSSDSVLALFGNGFSATGQFVTGGTVQAIAELDADTDEIDWYAQGLSLSAQAIFQTAQTPNKNDDLAQITAALSGNDAITLSPLADKMNGYAGDDNIEGGGGNDVLDGGTGTDTAIYSGSFAQATFAFQGQTLLVTLPGEGTDTLTNFEFLRFGLETRSVASLSDTVAPTIASFSPPDSATGVVPGSNIAITFSEAIQRGQGIIAIHSGSANGPVVEQFELSSSARTTIAGSVLTINPESDLASNTTYFVTIASGAIEDLAGNDFAGSNTYDFTTQGDPPQGNQWRAFAASGFVGEIGGHGTIFGTQAFQDIKVLDEAGSVTFDGSFNQGGDIVRLAGNASAWSITYSGSNAIFADADTQVIIPYGKNGTAIVFADGVRSLRFDLPSGDLKIGSQIVGETAAAITAATDGTVLPTGVDAAARTRLFLVADGEVTANGNLTIFGGAGDESVHLTSGNVVLDGSFNAGGDQVFIERNASQFTASLSGANLVLDSQGLDVTIPFGANGMDISFNTDVRTLVFDRAEDQVLLDNLVIGDTPITLG